MTPWQWVDPAHSAVVRILEDGRVDSRYATDPEVAKFLEDGGEPLAEAPQPREPERKPVTIDDLVNALTAKGVLDIADFALKAD